MQPDAALIGHAAKALAEALRFSGPADQVLSRHFRAHRELGQRERALIAETVFAVLRRKRTLEAACGENRPRDLVLAALVRLQGVSVRSLEAAISERERELLGRVKEFKPQAAPPAVRAELPDWLWNRLAEEFGAEEALALARGMLDPAPMDLRVNTLKATRTEALERLRADGLACEPTPYSPFGIRLATKPQINRYPLYAQGVVEVQDEGSQLLACLVAPRRGEMVVDFCAGAGGKTLALGAMMKNAGRLYAWEVSPKRLAGLAPRLARSGLSNVHPVAIASENDARARASPARSTACWWMRRARASARCGAIPISNGASAKRTLPNLRRNRRASSPARRGCSSPAGDWCSLPAACCARSARQWPNHLLRRIRISPPYRARRS